MPVVVGESEFEEMVRDALDALPDEFVTDLDNVAISVEDLPDPVDLERMGLDPVADAENLLGLYVGYPRTERGNWDVVLPDKISIYRLPICASCDTVEQVRSAVITTVNHEIGHYFGISDERLHELGWY